MKLAIRFFAILALLILTLNIAASAQNSNPTPNLAGTSWTVVETDGDNDIFNFLTDGTLSYSYQNGSFHNGTWKQDGHTIYIEMNDKYVEYVGLINVNHISGVALNVKNKQWSWTADLKPLQ